MGIFKIINYFNIIIYIIKIEYNNCSYSTIKDAYNGENLFDSKRKLINSLCMIKNCLACDKRNECINCKEGYELYKRRCYTKKCEIFGFCRFCDEYDCFKCIKGYKLNYGICEEKVYSPQKIILISAFSIIFICILIYLCYRCRKKAIEKIKTGQIIKFYHPRPGYYELKYDVNSTKAQETSQNKSLGSTTSESNGEKETPIINCCVVCGNKKTYSIADCGCSLCEQHFKIIKLDKRKIQCRIHKIILGCSMYFDMALKSNIKGNAVEKLGLKKCPICKINEGTQSFNCGCPMKVCENCFNDNIYVFKYNQCPGCGMPYNPKNTIKKENKVIITKI